MTELSLKDLSSKVAQKGADIDTVFQETKIDGASVDDGQWDFKKAKSFGLEGKGHAAVHDWLKESNAELAEITDELTARTKVQQLGEENDARQQAAKRVTHPGSSDQRPEFKSLSDRIGEDAGFKAWQDNGALGGITIKLDDMLPSDFMLGGGIKTLRSKTLLSTSAGYDPNTARLPGFVEDVTRPINLLDIIPLSRTDSDTVVYMEETTRTHSAAEKAEGGTYAESTFAFTERTSAVRKITDSLPVTDEQLADAAFINSYINDRLSFGVRQRLDLQVQVGDGTPPNLDGILNVSGIQTQAKGADPISDAFHKMMTLIRITGRATPTHHIMHPTDWQTVRLLRTADGVYIWGSPSEAGQPRMWGLPVVQSDNASAGTGYVGSFLPQWISLIERAGVQIDVGYTGSQFVEGKRTIRAQMRAAFILFRPAAFGTVTGI